MGAGLPSVLPQLNYASVTETPQCANALNVS